MEGQVLSIFYKIQMKLVNHSNVVETSKVKFINNCQICVKALSVLIRIDTSKDTYCFKSKDLKHNFSRNEEGQNIQALF